MKKNLLFICMLLALMCMLCIGVMAQEETTYYLYDDGSTLPEGENNISVSELYWQSETETGLFANLKDGDNIVIELKESIAYTPSNGTMNNVPSASNCLRINVAATVTVKFNGYSWWFTANKGYDAFVVYNEGATLNLIGEKAKNSDGTIKELGTNYTSAEINESIDVYSDFVVVYVAGGALNCENLAMSCREEIIYQKEGYLSGKADVELKDCSFRTTTGLYTVNLGGKSGSNNDIRIDGGWYGSICVHNPLDNSYIKNATVKETAQGNAMYIDSWKNRNAYNLTVENSTIDGRYWAEGDSNIIVGKDSSFGSLYLKGDGSGGAFVELTDCTYENVDFTGNKGTGQLTVYTSANCEKAGTKTIYDISNQAGVVDESYDAPATGHKLDKAQITGVIYESFLANGTYTSSCVVCGAENVFEEVNTAPALFTCKGYSASKTGVDGIALGFEVNNTAVKEYETITKKTLNYGVFAVSQAKLGEKDVFDAKGNAIEGSITAGLTSDFATFEVKVTGFTDEQKDMALTMGAYVKVTDDDTAEYSYLQSGTPAQNEKYCFVSYNDIVK